MKGRKMGWQKDEERNELCFDISANECFCLKNGSGFAGLGLFHWREKMKKAFIACLLASTSMAHAAVPVFQYSFPASYNGTGTAITDLSSAGNHAALYNSSDVDLIDDRPAGFDAALMSLTGANGGHGTTAAIDLLNTTTVAANGGFSMEVWFKWDGTDGTRKLIDYAGTEYLRTNGGQIQFGLSNGGTVLGHDMVAGQWYHALAVFDTTGNSAVEDPANSGEYKVNGDANLYIDGVLEDSATDVVKTGFGDSLNRSIGLNMWTQGGDWNQGMIFNPSVYLGVVGLEPAPPTIITQPQDAFASAGGSHTFTVLVSRSHPLSYQWMKNTIPLTGETSSALILSDIAMEDAGGYSAWVTNSLGSVTSTVATLTFAETDDIDGDGLPNNWEADHGLDPFDDGSTDPDNGAAGDPDHDGLPNDEEFFMNSDPQVNESGKPWQARPEKAQLMIISAHPDDESIFFGGAYPYYTQVRQLPTVSVSMTSGDYGRVPEIREAEFRNATWAYGLRNQPIFPRFKDSGTRDLDIIWNLWSGDGSGIEAGKEKATRTLAKWIRRYQPEVVLTHDFDGEYGHGDHIATAWATSWAVAMAADSAIDVDGLPAWQVKKLYIHNYDPTSPNGTVPIFHDFWQETSIDSDGDGTPDQTPIDTANVGSDFHVTQGQPNVSTCYASGETSSGWEPFPCEWWGLYSSTVGDDTVEPDFIGPNTNNNPVTYSGWAMGDFFEHLTTYPDSDYDLLSDPWELDHFADLAAADPTADDDLDGLDNHYEFITGLDPQVPDQLDMQLSAATHAVKFTLPTATGAGYEGLERRYRLKYSPDLVDWSTVVAEGIADGTPVTYPIPVGLQKGFYRLVITLE